VFIRESEDELVAGGTRSMWNEPFDSWREGNLVGTPEQICEKIRTYADLGVGGIVPWCSDFPETETLRLLAEKVMPEFR
jgi:alkanesulfonate monooxygenase SsuD/methylene tetrahydromethanopterin reductase-like flavin-dependent oxidoreductase (luciferase family)